MSNVFSLTDELRGMYRDVLRDPAGRVVWDAGWKKNTIVADCRRLLAALMRGGSNALGIQGLQVGSGSDTWDQPGMMPVAGPATTKLVDPKPFTVNAAVPGATFQMAYLMANSATPSNAPTNRLQIVATLGPNVPNWPKPGEHPSSTLREFGLVAQLEGQPTLVNYVIHPAIPKDPASTLERTIWLIF